MKFYKEYTREFWTGDRKRSIYLGALLLTLSIIIQILLGRYSSNRSLNAQGASDIFLDNLPVVNLTFLIVGGEIAVWVLAWFLLTKHPRYLLFGTKAIALYTICRSFFITLTHLGPYARTISPGPQNLGWGLYKIFTFQGNYFFSGHTGFPFLLALIFWDNRFWRWFFLFLTFVFGAAVLLAHVHYSIDVFAAPFIVYGMYVITAKIFPHDYLLTESEKFPIV